MSELGDDVELGLCHRCEKNLRLTGGDYCEQCTQNMAEMAYERQQDGECFRGNEAAAYEAEQQAWIQRNLK